MTTPRTLRIALNGVTGRMGHHQHLVRSILAIRSAGGFLCADGSRVQVEPVLVGRDDEKLRELSTLHDVEHWTSDVEAIMANPAVDIYFDAQVTTRRADALTQAIKAGKHVYTEKPIAESLAQAADLARLARDSGVTCGVVHDKLYLPGLVKLGQLARSSFFGRILSVRGEFGYWVFTGNDPARPAQRPSWNYRTDDGGGITKDMLCHWSYVLESIVGRVEAVTARAVTHIPVRWDESGEQYVASADDAVYAIFELEGGVVASINSSWASRVHRDELVEFQVDGTEGSAVAGLHGCVEQSLSHTPRPVWNPDMPERERFRSLWTEVSDGADRDNGFRLQWEEFLRDVVAGRSHRYDFLSAARGVQLAELALQSSAEGRRVEIPQIVL